MMVFSVRLIAYWFQWYAGLSLSLVLLVIGFSAGWTSPYMAQLTASDSTQSLKLTLSEASWIASILFLGRLCGFVLGASVQDFIGRQKTLLFSGPLFACGWTLVIFATSVQWLYAYRFLSGISEGIVVSALSLFLAEIADPKIRGTLIVWNSNATLIGIFIGNTMGTFLTMKNFSYVSLAVIGLFIALFAYVPESPYFYIANGNTKKAEESLKWYTRADDVQNELHELKEFAGSKNVNLMRRLKEFKKPEHRRNLIIMCFFNVFLTFAGKHAISSYAEIILTESKTSVKPSTIVMSLSLTKLVVGLIPMIFVDKLGRKPFLIISGLGICISLVLLGSQFHMLSLNFDAACISWLPVFALFLYYCSMAFGLSVVPQVLISELFPPNIKTLAVFLFSTIGSLMAFAVTKSFQPYLNLVGEKFVFWTYAVCALSCAVLTYFCIPETKQMRLVKIQERKLKC